MILVTVGTTAFPFKRMNDLVYKLSKAHLNVQKIIYQHGETAVPWRLANVTLFKYVPYKLQLKFIKESKLIISHGGPATIFLCNLYGKVPITVPRERKYSEHVNDHQVFFCNFMQKKNLVETFPFDREEVLLKYLRKPKRNFLGKVSSRQKLVRFLDQTVSGYKISFL